MWVRRDIWCFTKDTECVWPWAAALVLLVCVARFGASASHNTSEGYSGAAELTERFLTHKDDFIALGNMLDTDGPLLRKSRGPVDLKALTGVRIERINSYRQLLMNIGATALWYVPESQDTVALLLPGDAESSARIHLVHVGPAADPQYSQEVPEHYWRAPGVYDATRASPLEGRWFIRRGVEVTVVFPLY